MKIKRKRVLNRLGKKGLYGFVLVLFLSAIVHNPPLSAYLEWTLKQRSAFDDFVLEVEERPLLNASTTKSNYLLFSIYKTTTGATDKKEVLVLGIFNEFYWLKRP